MPWKQYLYDSLPWPEFLGGFFGFVFAAILLMIEKAWENAREARKAELDNHRLLNFVHQELTESHRIWTDIIQRYTRMMNDYRRDPFSNHAYVAYYNPSEEVLQKMDMRQIKEALIQVTPQSYFQVWSNFITATSYYQTTFRRVAEEVMTQRKWLMNLQAEFEEAHLDLHSTIVEMSSNDEKKNLKLESTLLLEKIRDEYRNLGSKGRKPTMPEIYGALIDPAFRIALHIHSEPEREFTPILRLARKCKNRYVRIEMMGNGIADYLESEIKHMNKFAIQISQCLLDFQKLNIKKNDKAL